MEAPDTPSTAAELFNDIAPNLTSALIALAGVVVLFALQQRAQRKEAERERFDRAFASILEALRSLHNTTQRLSDDVDVFEVGAEAWRFVWLLPAKDKPVGDWVFEKVFAAVPQPGSSEDEVRRAVSVAFPSILGELNEWRLGRRKAAWFAVDLQRLRAARLG
ncbi:hypothetical protein [Rathayibacter sp. VKM Ac-2927]|uniref:hypothetical protein n=1 Tax=Rathayibacter sp. VKM Ac-2927 TaxID=2929478 RepID=UPI001FB22AE6|nr:hypothetical protein [Rathayibacter sp. VKM Ac-2927]MCJ1687766.1 hypothetical protein [Rathayibacter sp. VKM Ac-2927]